MEQKKLVALDMDGVLTKHPSSWSYVHRHFGVDNSLNYAAYRAGKLSYPAFITEDVKLWLTKKNPIKGIEIMELMREIPLMDNLYSGLNELRKRGYIITIVSGGISWLADRISEKFTFDRVYSNSIDLNSEGNLTPSGTVGVVPQRKDVAIRELQETLAVSIENTSAVGDSDFDSSMYDAAGFRVAFNPSSQGLISAADLTLYSQDFLDLVKRIIKAH